MEPLPSAAPTLRGEQMQIIKRILNCCLISVLCNVIFLWPVLDLNMFIKIVGTVFFAVLYLIINISPYKRNDLPRKLKTLGGGGELILISAVCTVVQLCVYIYLLQISSYKPGTGIWIGSIVLNVVLLAALLLNGLIRLFFSSGQITTMHRVALIFLWWVPVVNIVAFIIVYTTAHKEYKFILFRHEQNKKRKEQKLCATKYPLLLVHGIFFRDWKHFNYWGRIPAELELNGASVSYGHQQSSTSVAESAQELKNCILELIEKQKCEKVNIIAHSKGGIDSRYAISRLGMDKYVASLTTINTPHRGCRFAAKALDKLPENLVASISKKYEKIFKKLGDDQPDFFSGVSELSDERCEELNKELPDCEGVLYQSFGSKMKSAGSAIFPLNLGYSIVNTIDGDNDGLVAVNSMSWGSEFTLLEPVGNKGISHGDVIDLTRKNIEGFDVCEFYIGIVQRLKDKGL